MSMPGCEGWAATTTTTKAALYMALPLLVVQVVATATIVTVFARSFILGNVTYFKYLYYL